MICFSTRPGRVLPAHFLLLLLTLVQPIAVLSAWAETSVSTPDSTSSATPNSSEKESFAEEDTVPPEVDDPWEGFNRAMFSFNDTLDVYFLEPVARGYDAIMPDPVESSINNFFLNLRTPIYLVSDLFQFRFDEFGLHASRFVINSTAGVAGFFDVAKHFDLEHKEQDFGLTLGRYGLDSGPYLVLPILGPSSLRDATAGIVDRFLDPVAYTLFIENLSWEERLAVDAGIRTVEIVNGRSRLLSTVESAKGASLDYYLFVRSAYMQRRRALVLDKAVEQTETSDTTNSKPLEEEEYIFDDTE